MLLNVTHDFFYLAGGYLMSGGLLNGFWNNATDGFKYKNHMLTVVQLSELGLHVNLCAVLKGINSTYTEWPLI